MWFWHSRFIWWRYGVLMIAVQRWLSSLILSKVLSFTVIGDAFSSIGLSILAVVTDGLDVITHAVGVLFATFGAGCVSCGGLDVWSRVTLLFLLVATVGYPILLRSSWICRSVSISSKPFLFLHSFSVCDRSFSAFTIVSSGVKVASVMYLCLKCTVSDTLLLFVLST